MSSAVHNQSVVIKILLLTHAIFWFSANLLAPFSSIFMIEELKGVGITEVGIGILIYSLAFGVLDPLVGYAADKKRGYRDEIYFILSGYVLRSLLFILFSLATTTWHMYIFSLFLGFSRALVGPADKVLYARYMSSRERGLLWGIDESVVNISAALGAGLGGYLISIYGFRPMYVVVGLVTLLAGVVSTKLFTIIKR